MPLRRTRPEEKSQEWRPKKSVRLYLDDVDEILAVMRQVDNEVRIRTAEHVGTIVNAEELREAGRSSLDWLELQAGSKTAAFAMQFFEEFEEFKELDYPYEGSAIFVRLSRPVVVRITPRDDLKLAAAGQAIRALLSRRQTRIGGWVPRSDFVTKLMSAVGGFAAAALVVFSATALARATMDANGARDLPPFLIPVMLLAAFGTAYYSIYKPFFGPTPVPTGTIVLAYRADAPTWWERNRTTVLISLITNVVVAGVFFVVGLWLA